MRTSNRLIRFFIVIVLVFLIFCTAAVIQNWDTLSAALTNMVMTLSAGIIEIVIIVFAISLLLKSLFR